MTLAEETALDTPMLRATRTSDVMILSKAIARAITQPGVTQVDLRAIGAAAVNQAVKSVAIANSKLVLRGVYVVMIPRFESVEGHTPDELISALTFRLRSQEM